MVDWLRSDGVPTEVLPTSPRLPGIVLSAWKLRRRIPKDEVVHANGVKAALVSTLATLGTRTPVVWVKHDHSWDGLLARLVAWRSAQVVGVSEAVTDTFKGRVRRKVHVVHNGLGEIEADAEAGRRALAELLGQRDPVISLVARIDPLKGHRELLAILPDLLQRFPRLGVAFIGGEHSPHLQFAADLKDEVRDAGLEGAVAFAGFRDDVLSLIAASDLVAMPSTVDESGLGREGFPYVGLESMAVGTPVVGYSHGGLPEMLGECGRLVPPGDRDALREAILELLADEGLRSRLAGEGTARVRERFSLERMVEAMKGRYREAAAAAGIMQGRP
jgi:glycosyltransferase involved in cell wall biosynthesis